MLFFSGKFVRPWMEEVTTPPSFLRTFFSKPSPPLRARVSTNFKDLSVIEKELEVSLLLSLLPFGVIAGEFDFFFVVHLF